MVSQSQSLEDNRRGHQLPIRGRHNNGLSRQPAIGYIYLLLLPLTNLCAFGLFVHDLMELGFVVFICAVASKAFYTES